MSDIANPNVMKSKFSLSTSIMNALVGEDGEVKWSTYQVLAISAGVIILIFYSMRGPTPWQQMAIGLLIAGASLAAGILIGFLFGIPRTLQRAAAAGGTGQAESYGVNTNLEQISDWLTKIIVGVGLVQLTVIPGKLRNLANYMATAFGAQAVPGALVMGIICYFGIFGFLLGYLWTRIYLTGEFSRIERATRDRPEYYEGLIHAYLYQPMPTGFQNAINQGLEYNERYGSDNWRVWLYLACAYAQQYSYISRDPKPDEEAKKAARDRSLDAVKRIVQINKAARQLLRGLWNPEQTNPLENDLEIFWDDRDSGFLNCLGNPGETYPPNPNQQSAG
jgi:hypothetical protein